MNERMTALDWPRGSREASVVDGLVEPIATLEPVAGHPPQVGVGLLGRHHERHEPSRTAQSTRSSARPRFKPRPGTPKARYW